MPDPGTAGPWTSVVWAADVWGPPWNQIWRQESTDSVLNKTQVGNDWFVNYTAAEVALGHNNRFHVAYCRTVNGQHGCTCWSNDTSYGAPTVFPSTQPKPPAPASQLVGDDFQRSYQTNPKRSTSGTWQGGDGLGPDRVWQDSWQGGSPGNGSYVRQSNGSSYAVMPQGAVAVYTAATALQPHSYVEAELTLDGTPTNYNFDIQGRRLTTSQGIISYLVKLHRGLRGAPSNATHLSIFQWDMATFGGDGTNLIDYVEFGYDGTACQPGSCSCAPPISGGDSATPVWLRLETSDFDANTVSVTASLYWDVAGNRCGDTIDSCPYRCTVTVQDDSSWAQSNMINQLGGWSLDVHEKTYRVLGFRAGSDTP